MKIENIKLYPIHTRRETGLVSQHIIVKMITDDGLVGVGEMSDLGHSIIMPDVDNLERCANKNFKGLDVFDGREIEAALRLFGHVVIFSGLEIALYDLRARALKVPLYQLLGGKYRTRIPVAYPVFRHRNEKDLELSMKLVAKKLEQDFNIIRLYVGVNPEMDEVFLKTLRETYNDRIKIKSLDISNMLDYHAALRLIKRLEKYEFMLVESPCRGFEDMARLKNKIGVPISEHIRSQEQARELIQKQAISLFNVAICNNGLIGAKKLSVFAEATGIKCFIGTTQELSIGTAAQAHLAASIPQLDIPCDPFGPCLYTEDVVSRAVKYEDSCMVLPEGDGLGISIDDEKLKQLTHPLSGAGESVSSLRDRRPDKK